jgi:hypothetical protein
VQCALSKRHQLMFKVGRDRPHFNQLSVSK